jgi:hypothetical protein
MIEAMGLKIIASRSQDMKIHQAVQKLLVGGGHRQTGDLISLL